MKRIIIFSIVVFVVVCALVMFLTKTTRAPQAPQNVKELTERIARLEELGAKLEKKSASSEVKPGPGTTATFSPDGKTIFTQDGKALRVWQGSQSSPQVGPAQVPPIPVPTAPAKQVPPGWKTKEFNGMTYYMVPLTEHSAR